MEEEPSEVMCDGLMEVLGCLQESGSLVQSGGWWEGPAGVQRLDPPTS